MKSFRKIHDLTPHQSAPLVITRAPRTHRNLLRIERKKFPARETKTARSEFEFRENPAGASGGGIFVPERASARFNFSRVKIATSALVLVLLLNLVGVFGEGRATLERAVSSAFFGVAELTSASKSFAAGDFSASTNQFGAALTAFQSVEKDLLVLGGAGAVLATKPEDIQAGSALITAGRLLADAGKNFASATQILVSALPTYFAHQTEITRGIKDVPSFTAELQTAVLKITDGFTLLDTAKDVLGKIEITALPTELQAKVRTARTSINLITTLADPYREALPLLPALLGENGPKKYLILFQNPDEIRPTGGFIGSFAEVTLRHGFVEKFQIRDVYEIDGQLVGRFPPPEGFGFITNSWGLRDANYHPDFPTSAASAAYLYEEAGGGSIDGVFAITSNLLTKLVALTGGELKLARYATPISAEDLNLLLSLVVETKTDGAENPKQILTEAWEVLREKLAVIPHAEVFPALTTAIREKEIQFWTANPEEAKFPRALALDGALRETTSDYLFVVNTSLSGNKSDRYAENTLALATEITKNGIATNTLTLTRTHGWNVTEEKKIQTLAQTYGVKIPNSLFDILGAGRNVDLVKVFVPRGAELTVAEGIALDRITTEQSLGKTYFSFSFTIPAGESRTVELTYTLPNKFQSNYELLVEKQAGERPVSFERSVSFAGEIIADEKSELTQNQSFEIPLKQ